MLKLIGGMIAGVIAWTLLVTVLNLGLRYGWHDYAAVEKSMAFTIPMMVARLSISAISSLASGFIARLAGKRELASLGSGLILLLLFLPVHYSLFDKFPIWYHLAFLVSLPLLSVVGGKYHPANTTA